MRKENFSIGVLDVDYIRGGGIDPFTKRWFIDPVNGSDGNTGKTITNARKTFSSGYGLATENKNEVVYILGGASALAQTAVLAISKDYTHVIGLTAPLSSGGRVRFTNTVATATAGEYTIDTVGSIYSNLHFQFGDSATAGSLIGVALSGDGRNLFNNCHFNGPFDAGIGAAVGQRMMTITASQDNKFKDCFFGQRTILNTAATGAVISFEAANCTNNVFENCQFVSYNSNTASAFICFNHLAMADSGYTIFKKCTFIDVAKVAMADPIRWTTGEHGHCILDDCKLFGTAIAKGWGTNNRTTTLVGMARCGPTGGVAVASAA